jgi:hypothetical protein
LLYSAPANWPLLHLVNPISTQAFNYLPHTLVTG